MNLPHGFFGRILSPDLMGLGLNFGRNYEMDYLKFLNPHQFNSGERFLEYARSRSREYSAGLPFPHIVFDDLLNNAHLEQVLAELDKVSEFEYEKSFHGAEKKFGKADVWELGNATRELLFFLNSQPVLLFLETLSGIEGLISDSHFFGGGYHEIRRGGFLKMHTDFNWHQKLHLDRRLNLLLYLNKDWKPEWGGQVQLADSTFQQTKAVDPTFNRIVVFSTTDYSFHGHPDPLECPDERKRQSLALYYYTNGRPEGETNLGRSIRTNYQSRYAADLRIPAISRFLARLKK